jgi:hypothetical protein
MGLACAKFTIPNKPIAKHIFFVFILGPNIDITI